LAERKEEGGEEERQERRMKGMKKENDNR
jgi:hypothetical protein